MVYFMYKDHTTQIVHLFTSFRRKKISITKQEIQISCSLIENYTGTFFTFFFYKVLLYCL